MAGIRVSLLLHPGILSSLNMLLRSKCRIPNRKLWDRHVQSGLCLQRSAFGGIGWLWDSSTVMELQEC